MNLFNYNNENISDNQDFQNNLNNQNYWDNQNLFLNYFNSYFNNSWNDDTQNTQHSQPLFDSLDNNLNTDQYIQIFNTLGQSNKCDDLDYFTNTYFNVESHHLTFNRYFVKIFLNNETIYFDIDFNNMTAKSVINKITLHPVNDYQDDLIQFAGKNVVPFVYGMSIGGILRTTFSVNFNLITDSDNYSNKYFNTIDKHFTDENWIFDSNTENLDIDQIINFDSPCQIFNLPIVCTHNTIVNKGNGLYEITIVGLNEFCSKENFHSGISCDLWKINMIYYKQVNVVEIKSCLEIKEGNNDNRIIFLNPYSEKFTANLVPYIKSKNFKTPCNLILLLDQIFKFKPNFYIETGYLIFT